MIEIFNKDIWNYIFRYLKYIDCISLLRAYPNLYHDIDPKYLNVQNVINSEMTRFKLKYDNLVYRMGNTGILYGGLLLGIIRNHIYKDSDVDLIHYDYKDNIYYPVKEITLNVGRDNTFTSTYNYNSQTSWTGCVGEVAYPIFLIKTDGSSSDDRMYQHNSIITPTPSLAHYLNQMCDLEFTKIYYDGTKIHIKDLNSIITKTCHYNINYVFKYMFKIYFECNNNKWIDDLWISTIKRIIFRINKYRSRNFNVIINYHNQNIDTAGIIKNIISKYGLISTPLIMPLTKRRSRRRHHLSELNNYNYLFDYIKDYDALKYNISKYNLISSTKCTIDSAIDKMRYASLYYGTSGIKILLTKIIKIEQN